MNGKTIVMGVIGSDVHAVGIRILAYTFSQAGFKVINLGVMVSQEEYVKAAIETAADAVLVSSLYGHGEIDCRGLKEKFIEAGLAHIPLYVGGNLVVGKTSFSEVEARFKAMGFRRVYPPGTLPDQPIADIRHDLGLIDEPPESSGQSQEANGHAGHLAD